MNKVYRKLMILSLWLILLGSMRESVHAQGVKAYFPKDSIRIEAGASKNIDTVLSIIVPTDSSAKKGKVRISFDKNKSTADLTKLKTAISNEFALGDLKDTMKFAYGITVPRNDKDDRSLVFTLAVYDSTGKQLKLVNNDTSVVVYIKPFQADSLSSNDNWEFWIFTGANFDLFNGIQADQFFFKSNTLFKISNHFYSQVAFYKNRYFSFDTSSAYNSFSQQIPIVPPNDSIKYSLGTYDRTVKQTTDVVGLQFDMMYKFNKPDPNSVSTFFGTLGFDVSTRTVKFENTFSNFDSVTITRKKSDTVIHFSPLPPKSYSYQKPVYNFNVGFLWILNTDKINIKGQLTGGISSFSEPVVIIPAFKGVSIYKSYTKTYMQMRMFGTYKPVGISLGFDMFARRNEIPQFNFTLSKVFDLSNFLTALTPVSSLKLK